MIEDLKSFIFDLLSDDSKTLIFTSEVVARSWLRRFAMESGNHTVFLDRAISWDRFKTQFVQPGNLRQVANLDRQLFANEFVSKHNEELTFFTSKYKESMQPFAMAIAGYLPFFAYKDEKSSDAIHDIDLIVAAYKEYLSNNGLFEYNFMKRKYDFLNKNYVLIFPETFNDPIVDEIKNRCTVLSIDSINEKDLTIYSYENSLSEIRNTVRAIYQNLSDGVDANDIALTCASIDTYRPYLEEEANKYGINLCFTSSRKLTSCVQGQLFQTLYRVKNENYSFDSVKELLLNPGYPFKDVAANRSLVQSAIKYRLKRADSKTWISVLKDENKDYFIALSNSIDGIFETDTKNAVEKIKQFVSDFFVEDAFFFTQNNVYEKCLEFLAQTDSYQFFLQVIDSENYIDPARNGIRVYKYPVSAAIAADVHYVIGLDDKNTAVSFDKYPYLPAYLKDKNELKKTVKTDDVFSVYTNQNFFGKVILSGTKKGFDGSRLLPVVLKENSAVREYRDLYEEEREGWLNSNNPVEVTKAQQEGFLSAQKSVLKFDKERKIITNLSQYGSKISASKFKDFCKCPYKGYVSIYLNPKQCDFEPNYLDRRVLGNILHEAIQNSLKDSRVQNFMQLNNEVLKEHLINAVKEHSKNYEVGPVAYQQFVVERYSRILPDITKSAIKAEKMFESATLSSNESGAEGDFVFDQRLPNVSLHGRPDTVLNFELSYIILDYKTTDYDKNKETNPQIALYAQIMNSKGQEVVGGAYYIIEDSSMRVVWPTKDSTWDKVQDKLVGQEKSLADSIINNQFEFTQNTNDCAKCPYQRICRRRYSEK